MLDPESPFSAAAVRGRLGLLQFLLGLLERGLHLRRLIRRRSDVGPTRSRGQGSKGGGRGTQFG